MEIDNKPKMFIFLHGYNETGISMKHVGDKFKAVAPRDSVFLYPDAPFKIKDAKKFCWFQVVLNNSINTIDEELIFESMNQSLPYLSNYIEQNFEQYRIFDYKDVVLTGFSQGAVFSLHASLMMKKSICSAISFSGGFANPDKYISKHKINKMPILIIHGANDKILPYQYSLKGEKELKQEGFDIECHILENTKHIITPNAIDIAQNFLTRIFNNTMSINKKENCEFNSLSLDN